ncbi:MAG TPA: isochorismatase family protein [Xanthobacteraceae bacterium]|jgi:nicotinamidase-related amidase
MAKGLDSSRLATELWRCITPEERRIVEAAGYGQRIGFGARPALLVVDVTYGFCGRTPKPILQSIAEQRRSCGESAWDAVECIVPILQHARHAKIPVIFSAMEDPSSPEYEPGLWGGKNRRGSEDARSVATSNKGENQIVAEIAPAANEMVFAKNKPSMFKDTGLLPYLIAHRVDSLLICGGTTSGCVYATAVDGFSNNYKVAVIADASFDRVQTAHWVFLMDIDMKYGDVVSSAATVEYLNSRASAVER